jgi:Lar family restriction alleviation protein
MSEMMACPFCGGAAEWCSGEHGDGSPWRYIACADCEAMGPAAERDDGDTQKTAAWNRRAVPQDVVDLVIAARVVAFEDQSQEALDVLDQTSEAFADRVPWEDEPEDAAARVTPSDLTKGAGT